MIGAVGDYLLSDITVWGLTFQKWMPLLAGVVLLMLACSLAVEWYLDRH